MPFLCSIGIVFLTCLNKIVKQYLTRTYNNRSPKRVQHDPTRLRPWPCPCSRLPGALAPWFTVPVQNDHLVNKHAKLENWLDDVPWVSYEMVTFKFSRFVYQMVMAPRNDKEARYPTWIWTATAGSGRTLMIFCWTYERKSSKRWW